LKGRVEPARSGLLGQLMEDPVSRRTLYRTLSGTACLALAVAVAPTASAGTLDSGSTSVSAASAATHTVVLPLSGDTWVSNLSQTTSQSTSPELQVGSKNLGLNRSRSYLDFDYSALDGVPADAVISSAQLSLSDFAAATCTGTAVRALRVTGAWTVAGLKWSAQPGVTTLGSGTSTAAFGANGCAAEGTATFDVSGIVHDWLGGAARRGIQVKADNESASSGYRKYRSAENGDASRAPTLTVTYNSYPATPTDLTVAPGNPGFATSLTPTLSADVTDPEGTVGAYFEVRKGTLATSPIVWSGFSDQVTSGDEASVEVPPGVLTDATIYSVVAYGYDGTLRSKAVAATKFKVDVTAPTATITSDVFTNGTWTNPMPASAKFTLDGSTDTGGFYVTTDGVDFTVGANATGDYATTLTPTPGWHTTTATPVDRAGNVGTTTTFSWGTGAPEFARPAFWEQSTGTFPVEINAAPTASGATLQWHLPGEKAWHTATHLTRGDAVWDGSVTNGGGRATTGQLTWDATAEPLGSGTLKAPAYVLIRGCFQYAAAADACTAERYVQLVEQ
jgi:hypothetical protein